MTTDTLLPSLSLRDRARGALLGLACGDSVGAQVEFLPRDSFPPVRDMVGGGFHRINPGDWTDDTSMAACLAESLVTCHGHDPHDQLERYLAWRWTGYLSPKGYCFDIGGATSRALLDYELTGEAYRVSDGHDAGNGSLMRLAPVALAYWDDHRAAIAHAGLQSQTTHAHPIAVDACRFMAWLLVLALRGGDKARLVAPFGGMSEAQARHLHPAVYAVAAGSWRGLRRAEVRSGGYCLDSLEAALWCFERTDSFEACILEAANLGKDADTTAAIAGQLAGAYYGEQAIPLRWRQRLWGYDWLAWHADALTARA
jgi:ADP-ribosyl-[dinitrogen reductase] hydrolase